MTEKRYTEDNNIKENSICSLCINIVSERTASSWQRKEKKQKGPRKNNYRRRLRRWHSDTGKYTQPSRNITA